MRGPEYDGLTVLGAVERHSAPALIAAERVPHHRDGLHRDLRIAHLRFHRDDPCARACVREWETWKVTRRARAYAHLHRVARPYRASALFPAHDGASAVRRVVRRVVAGGRR